MVWTWDAWSSLRLGLFMGLAVGLVGGCADESPSPSPPSNTPEAEEDPSASPVRDDALLEAATDDPTAKPQQPPYPPTAKPDIHEMLVASRRLEHHLADGGGTARLLEGESTPAGALGRWVIEYTAGPEGIRPGGSLHFQVPPYWEWSPPQTEVDRRPGYTEIRCSDDAVRLEPKADVAKRLLILDVLEAPLRAGETITLDYGATVGAVADRYAEAEETFHLWVDGDGDGTRKLIAQDVVVAITPRACARLAVHLPSTARPGEEIELVVAALDRLGNAVRDVELELEIRAAPELQLPERARLEPADAGSLRLKAVAAEGIHSVAVVQAEQSFVSNPMVVTPGIPPIYWADLHGHSSLSDGTGTPEDYYRYARDTAALDVCALTDHDHYGLRALDDHPEIWRRLCECTDRFHEPGRFVTIHGYEWTSWLYGHRHVLLFGEPGAVLSSLDEGSDRPDELWEGLRERDAMTLAHHPASGATVAVDWSFAPPPELEPVVEIVSVHGNSEGPGAPQPVRGMVAESSVRAALARGYELGFVGSGDSHDGHPGLAQLASPSGGLAAIRADELSREGIRDALRRRATYATNGPRIFVSFRSGRTPMGAKLRVGTEGLPLSAFVVGTAELERVEIVKNGEPLLGVRGEGSSRSSFDWTDVEARSGDYYYLRVVQTDGGLAWSSPIWLQ